MMASLDVGTRKILIWGYVREIERMYKINIPYEINDIIYLYQKVCDEWDATFSSKRIKIEDDKSSLTVQSIGASDGPTAYGSVVVCEGIFKWRIKIIGRERTDNFHESPYIGIVEDKKEFLEESKDDDHWDQHGYQLCAGDQSGVLCSGMDGNRNSEFDMCYWDKEEDILEMTLDLDKRVLGYKINDEDFGEAYLNIQPAKYRLALTLDALKTYKVSFL